MTFKRILLYLLSQIINFDSISEMFPVSVKSIIFDDKRVLLIKNQRDEWDLPGGKIEKKEDVIETLVREVKEELNISIGDFSVFQAKKYLFRKQEIIVITYCSKITNHTPIRISFENMEYNFFDLNELSGLKLTPWAKNNLEEFTKKIS